MIRFLKSLWYTLLGIASIVAVIAFGALGVYIGGHILLPKMGLTAPGYGTWLAFTCVTVVFGGAMYAIKEWYNA